MEIIISFIQRAILQGTPLLFGATGEILTEKSGNLNLGIPGIMYIGAISGVVGGFFYQNSAARVQPVPAILIPLLCCLAGSLLTSLLYCFLTVTLKANQNVTGLTLTIFGGGVANFFGGALNTMAVGVGQISVATTSAAYRANIPALAEIAHANGAYVMIDNTFTTAISIRPLDKGADIVINSMTKFMNGHSNAIAGSITASAAILAEL